MASQTKKHEKSPDYWGEIAINVSDLTKVEKQGDLLIFRLNGWKRKADSGATYLSLSVDRWVSDRPTAKPRPTQTEDIKDDIPW
jgi:hypothetical protein